MCGIHIQLSSSSSCNNGETEAKSCQTNSKERGETKHLDSPHIQAQKRVKIMEAEKHQP